MSKLKKILTIGDVHGRPYWKIPIFGYEASTNTGSKYTIDDFDKVIFVGDYLDSFDISNIEMKHNLIEIINLAKKYPDKVELLWGNHEIHYLLGPYKHKCSGFREVMQWDFGEILNKNMNLFKLAYQYKNYLWTHAGVTTGWYKSEFNKWMIVYDKYIESENQKIKALDGINFEEKPENLAEYLNIAFERRIENIFYVCYRRGGAKFNGSPLWVDLSVSHRKPLQNYHQIVGHTPVDEIKTITYKKKNSSITYVDTQQKHIDQFHIIEI